MRTNDTPDEPKPETPTVLGRFLGARFYHKSPQSKPADEPVEVVDDKTPDEPVPVPEPTPAEEPAVIPDPPVSLEKDAKPAAGTTAAKRHMSAATTRRVLAAVAIGAIVAAIATIFIAGGFKKDNDLAVTPPGESAGRAEGQTFLGASSGSCFTWTDNGADIGEIDCAEPHKFEVAAVIDLSQYPGTEFAPGSTYPDVLRFTELQQEHCDGAVNDYMRMKFDPNGKYEVGSINPGQDGWNAGERTLLCGIKLVKPSGVFMPMGGPVLGQDQSKIWDTGTCFGISQSQATDMVDCKQPHAFEVAGFVDLSTQFPGGPPSEEDQQKFLNEACGKVVDDYLGSPDALRNKTLTAFAGEPLNAMSWLSGSRKVNCHVGKSNADGFAPIVGSAKGDILIDGQAPVPPPPEPEGRALPTPLPGAAPLRQPPG